MNHTVTDVAPCRKRIELSFSTEEVAQGFDEVYRDIADSVAIKGFRKGHTPRRVLERKFGKTVNADVARHVFQKAVADVFEKDKISPMEAPEFKPDENTVTPGQPFTHAFEIDVRPVFDCPAYAGLELKDDVAGPADADVDAQLQRYQRAFSKYNPVEEPAQKEDVLKVDLVVTAGEKEIVNEKDQHLRVDGEELLGLPCPGFADKLVGAKIGDAPAFDLTLPADHPEEALRGQTARAVVTIKGVERPELAPLNDDFASRIGFDTLDKLRERIRANLAGEKNRERRASLERQAIDQLIARCPFDLPEAYLKRRVAGQLMQTRLRLAREGATREFLQEKAAEMEEASRQVTERSIRWSIISDAIAEKENFEITQEDVTAHVDALARRYQTTPAKMLRQLRDADGMYALASEIRDGRVMDIILNQSTVDGKPYAKPEGPAPADDAAE